MSRGPDLGPTSSLEAENQCIMYWARIPKIMVPRPKPFMLAGLRKKFQKHDFPFRKRKTLEFSAQWAIVDEREMHIPGKLSRTGGEIKQ